MYSEQLMEEFLNPKNYGVIKGASSVGKTVSDVAGEIIKIFMKVEDNKIVDCKFQTFGGVVAIAATSIANRLIVGKSLAELKKFNANQITNILGEVPENKKYILPLVASAVVDAVDNYYEKLAR